MQARINIEHPIPFRYLFQAYQIRTVNLFGVKNDQFQHQLYNLMIVQIVNQITGITKRLSMKKVQEKNLLNLLNQTVAMERILQMKQ